MIKQNELKTITFLPEFLQNHPDMIALTTVIDNRIKDISSRLERLELLKRIEDGELTNEEIELLLWERHVDYFDEDLSKEQKIELIKNSITAHYKKGTKANLEKVLKIIFGNFTLLEWFEYGGEPYHFKVMIDDYMPSQSIIQKLNKTVEEYKNTRSCFEGIMVKKVRDINIYDCIAKYKVKYQKKIALT